MVEALGTKRYLVHFIKKFRYLDFCLPEFESLVNLYFHQGKLPVATLRDQLYCQPRDTINVQRHPCVYVNLPGRLEVTEKVVKRSILIKEVIDVISEAKSYEQLLENVDTEKLIPLLESGKSFKFNIEGIGRKVGLKEQIEIIESFGRFPFKPNINLVNPDMIFKIIENQTDHVIYFGLQLVDNRVEEDTYHFKYDLRKRPYLGPTSTDHELAFLMANQG